MQTHRPQAYPDGQSPETLARAARPDGTARKRLYLTKFGWNNCAANSIAYNTDAGTTARKALQAKLSKAFARTYRAKFVCEEEP